MQDAIATANTSREAARDAANELMGKTAPVSHEAKVATAKDALQKLLDDPTSTTADIENATTVLRDALQPVGKARTQANETAKSLIDIVKPSAAGQVPAVQKALKKLQDIMNRAAGDNADALTTDIEAATKALDAAVETANNAIEAARNAAKDSSTNLTADIEAAIKALQTAVAEAEARNVVVPPVQHPTNQSAPTPASTVETVTETKTETVPQTVTEVQTQAVPVPTVETVYVTQPVVAHAQTPTVYALPYATESNRIGTLPNTGYKDDWRLMALGIFLFSSTLLLLAAKRRKKDEED